jgi:hypothetical protein
MRRIAGPQGHVGGVASNPCSRGGHARRIRARRCRFPRDDRPNRRAAPALLRGGPEESRTVGKSSGLSSVNSAGYAIDTSDHALREFKKLVLMPAGHRRVTQPTHFRCERPHVTGQLLELIHRQNHFLRDEITGGVAWAGSAAVVLATRRSDLRGFPDVLLLASAPGCRVELPLGSYS